VFDQRFVSSEYKNVKYVIDLPEKDINDCLLYLNYITGTTVHTGGYDFQKMYMKYKKNLPSSSNSGSASFHQVDGTDEQQK
jgi:hypothetical protein